MPEVPRKPTRGAGWTAYTPGDPPLGGREPWIAMSDIDATGLPGLVVISFRWQNSAEKFVVMFEVAESLDPRLVANHIIEKLDIFLSRNSWRDSMASTWIGDQTIVVPVPRVGGRREL